MINNSINKYNPDIVSHPGLTLAQKLEELGMSQKDFAIRTGRPEKTISNIIRGKSAITKETAIQFENVLNIPARFWLQRQYYYDDYVARLNEEIFLLKNISWISNFPLKKMREHSLIPNIQNKSKIIKELLTFFRVASPNDWEETWKQFLANAYFRKSNIFSSNLGSISVWLRFGEIIAENNRNINKYDENTFKKYLLRIRDLITSNSDNVCEIIKTYFSEAGVNFVLTPQFPKAPISGVSRWYADNPLIQMSLRYKTDDHFWFTLFHESAHILLHGKKQIFIELDKNKSNHANEIQADKFAAEFLIPLKKLNKYLDNYDINDESIVKFANSINITPSIVVGRLQHDKVIPFSCYNHLRKQVAFVNYDKI